MGILTPDLLIISNSGVVATCVASRVGQRIPLESPANTFGLPLFSGDHHHNTPHYTVVISRYRY
jgi:hypothetical protein